jgi:hypothetical protein
VSKHSISGFAPASRIAFANAMMSSNAFANTKLNANAFLSCFHFA